ncbi:MAG: zinc-binding dehydrogenase [Chloroflexi bacterium]|nr:zinc-binding dehydrogenase [Chloroflexota bacterium]
MSAPTMRAAVLHEWGGRLSLEEVPRPEPAPGEVLVRVRACAPDQFDVTISNGRVEGVKQPPTILGHEIAGDLVAVGTGVDGLAVGDRVTVFIYLICGRCRFCLVGRDTLCENWLGYVGVHTNGGLAEFTAVPAQNVVRIPDKLDYASACIIPGAVAAAYHAITRRLQVRATDTVVVVGAAGGVGVHAVQLAKLAGARVIGVDVSADRLERVKRLGADAAIEVGSGGGWVDEVLDLTGGQGADKALELVGTTESLERSFRSLGTTGVLAIMGFQPGSEFRVDPTRFVNREIVVTGSRSVSRQELAETISLVARGACESIVSERRSLAEAQRTMEQRKAHQVYGRVAIEP